MDWLMAIVCIEHNCYREERKRQGKLCRGALAGRGVRRLDGRVTFVAADRLGAVMRAPPLHQWHEFRLHLPPMHQLPGMSCTRATYGDSPYLTYRT